ncbi:MAG: hypothetical protein DWI22_21215 [Planctomycetota bacterium]|nr:MAG: hypothetical protein DWI22_21215 [Planctomycetota bacterium]
MPSILPISRSTFIGSRACFSHRVVFTDHTAIHTENSAIAEYNKLIRLCDGIDYVTQDLCITSLADE